MVSIKTDSLRGQAELLNREVFHYNYRFQVLNDCLHWLKRQEFEEVYEIHRVLVRQCDEMKQQKRELAMLAEAMYRICDKYDRTEQTIIENGEAFQKLAGRVEAVNLDRIREQLSQLGMRMAEQ